MTARPHLKYYYALPPASPRAIRRALFDRSKQRRSERGLLDEPQPGKRTATRTATRADKTAFVQEFLIVWCIARSLLLLPVSFTKTGVVFGLRSAWTRVGLGGWLTMVGYTGAVAVSLGVREYYKALVRRPSVQEASMLMTIFFIAVFTVCLPVYVFSAMPAFRRLATAWERMEVMYAALTGAPPELGWPARLLIFGYLYLQILLALLVYAIYDQLGLSLWQLVPLIHSVGCLFWLEFVWLSSWAAVGLVALSLSRRLATDLPRLDARGLRAHRILWLKVVQLFHMNNDCWGSVQLFFLFCMFVLSIAYFFNFTLALLGALQVLHGGGQGTLRDLLNSLVVYTCSGGGLLFLCLAAQFVIDMIHNPARKHLLRVPVLRSGNANVEEVQAVQPVRTRGPTFSTDSQLMLTTVVSPLGPRGKTYLLPNNMLANFLGDIERRKPVISIKGFFRIDRSLFVTMVAACSTYIVVLSQFTIQAQSWT